MELDVETQWAVSCGDTARDFARRCRDLCAANPSDHHAPLDVIISTMMTELWDFGFSQSEIKGAFTEAIAAMPAYAAGEERRGQPIVSAPLTPPQP